MNTNTSSTAARALQAAIHAAERQRDQARRTLGQQQHALRGAQGHMAQLQDYIAEMQQRWGARSGQSLPCELLRHHTQFMARMEHACALQARVLQAQHSHVSDVQRRLMEQEVRLQSLQELAARRRQQHMHQHTRREQQHADERSALQFLRQRRGLNAHP